MAMKQRLSHSRLFARNERESRYRRDAEQNTEDIAGGDIVEANVRTFFADCNWRQQRLSEQEYESFWTGELLHRGTICLGSRQRLIPCFTMRVSE
jgi:hypothetical protein